MNIGFAHEPAAWVALVAAIIEAVLGSNAINMNPDLKTALLTLVPLVAGAVVRQLVTPNVKVPAPAAKP